MDSSGEGPEDFTGNPWDFRCKAVEPKGKKPGGVLDVSLWADLEDGSGWESGGTVGSNEMGDAGMCFFCWGGGGGTKMILKGMLWKKNEEMSIFRSIKLTFNILLFHIFRVRRFPLKDDNS